jgi:hypothetical protein
VDVDDPDEVVDLVIERVLSLTIDEGPVLRKLSPAAIGRQMGNRPMTLLYSS